MGVRKRTRKRKDGSKSVKYEAEVYVKGVRVAYGVFDVAAEAHAWFDKTQNEYRDGRSCRTQDPTLRDVFAQYREQHLPTLKPQTQQVMAIRFPYILESPIADQRMSDIDESTLDEWFAWMRQHPSSRHYKRKNFRQEFTLLQAILNWFKNNCDPAFVVPILKRHRKAVYFKAVAPRRPDHYMRPDEIRTWLAWLRDRTANRVYYHLAVFMVLTGTRVGEATGLFWDAVDLDTASATIIRTVWWDHATKEPRLQSGAKTAESVRIVKLPPVLVTLLRELKINATSGDPVFNKDGALLRYPAVQNAFNRAFRQTGLPWTATHICRHTFGTLGMMATRDTPGMQAAMGHSDQKQTLEYAKIAALLDPAAATRTAELIGLTPESVTGAASAPDAPDDDGPHTGKFTGGTE